MKEPMSDLTGCCRLIRKILRAYPIVTILDISFHNACTCTYISTPTLHTLIHHYLRVNVYYWEVFTNYTTHLHHTDVFTGQNLRDTLHTIISHSCSHSAIRHFVSPDIQNYDVMNRTQYSVVDLGTVGFQSICHWQYDMSLTLGDMSLTLAPRDAVPAQCQVRSWFRLRFVANPPANSR